MRYRVDGICVESDDPLPGLEEGTGQADWRLDVQRLDPSADSSDVAWTGSVSDAVRVWGHFGRVGTAEARILLAGVGELRAQRAERKASLLVAQPEDLSVGTVRRFLPYLAALSGKTVLHAAGVVFPRGAVLLVGDAGVGKSTLATALDAAGHPVLGDDHVALDVASDGRVSAHPSVHHVEVGPESRRVFRPEAPASTEKSPLALRTETGALPHRVFELCFLARGSVVMRAEVGPHEVARRLLLQAVFYGNPSDPAEIEGRLADVAQIALTVPAYDLTLPDGLERLRGALPEIADLWSATGPEPAGAGAA